MVNNKGVVEVAGHCFYKGKCLKCQCDYAEVVENIEVTPRCIKEATLIEEREIAD